MKNHVVFKKAKQFRFVISALILVAGIAFLFSDYFEKGLTQISPTTCQTCEENYYNCRFDVPQCVEDKVQRCRLEGGDESQCENARPQYEQQCSDACYSTYSYCWALCSPGTGTPPRDYPSADCPGYFGNLAPVEADGSVTGAAGIGAFNWQLSAAAVVFYVDGDPGSGISAGSAHANTPTNGMPHYFSFKWEIPQEFRDGQKHKLYAYVEATCRHNTFLVPLAESPRKFILQP